MTPQDSSRACQSARVKGMAFFAKQLVGFSCLSCLDVGRFGLQTVSVQVTEVTEGPEDIESTTI